MTKAITIAELRKVLTPEVIQKQQDSLERLLLNVVNNLLTEDEKTALLKRVELDNQLGK